LFIYTLSTYGHSNKKQIQARLLGADNFNIGAYIPLNCTTPPSVASGVARIWCIEEGHESKIKELQGDKIL